MKPTTEFYGLFQFLYEYYNRELFKDELPNCMITITRKNNTLGYYTKDRWVNSKEKKTDEISINPMYFSEYPLVEILQTLCHEMCHLWQHRFGNPSRRAYHNFEWSEKMQSIGLMPSDTGKEGGKKTGQHMMDYPIENGNFIICSEKLVNDSSFNELWYDRYSLKKEALLLNSPTTAEIEEETNLLYTKFDIKEPLVSSKRLDISKTKYTCPNCHINLWGKPDLYVICGKCGVSLD